MNTLSIELARVGAELSGLSADFVQYEGVELVEKPDAELVKEIADFEKMSANIGSVNLRALDLYDEAERQYAELVAKKERLVVEKTSVLGLMDEIELRKKELFMVTLVEVQQHFQRIFSQLTTKGVAELELENPEQPFSEGVLIKVKLTGTKFLDLRSLSGGEKTLTALALIFSIQEFEPASFYVMDEVDAALDKHNSEKLAKLIRKYTDKAQYLVISHNDAVISEADVLYGVSMGDHGLSNVVSLKI